ncbi:LysE family translocator [Thiomicrorhabdus indica]|uniref:LysE family translocator n=1 Tax=Thiomicrorhabdus indica TaxID=2267253 RepID=UPI002AA9614A|nr:LysE family translocator [Thiomicrorhabdus indica]
MSFEIYSLFFVTTVLLIMVPGPSAMVAASQGAALQSKRAGLGVLGIASGDAFFFLLSATGIATLILASHTLFEIIKWLGVAFLVYLGAMALFAKGSNLRLGGMKTSQQSRKLFSQGLAIQISNPKALMYFTALLPQFIDPNDSIFTQLMLMGTTVFIADLLVYSGYALLGAHLARQQLKSWVVHLVNKTAGFALLYTGVKMAMMEQRS